MVRVVQLGSRLKWFAVVTAIAVLSGCGGGGGGNTCVNDPNRNPLLPGCETSTPTTPTGQSSITLSMTDTAGNPTNTISPTSPGIVQALVKDTNGVPAPNVAVTFTTTDKTGGFVPASGSALTDSNGIARVTLLAGTVAGAFTVTATTPGTTSGTVITIGTGGTIVISTVSAGTATLGYAVNVPNLPATALGSIKFVGASTTNIALKGTGGAGRQEFSTLTFQVFDQTGHAVAGTQVNFTLNTTVGGLSLTPTSALTDANGMVSTVVSAGTVPTPFVIVTASIPNTGITTVSSVLVVSTGLAVNKRISISTSVGNFEGLEFDLCPMPQSSSTPKVSMSMADHFGNPVPDGSSVSFTAEYGSIGASCLTGAAVTTTPSGQTTNSAVSGIPGACSVVYCSSGVRPPDGRSVVMGFIRGEEDFFDANGNNVCDNCNNTVGPEFTPAFDLSPDIFRDDNENFHWDPNEPCIGPNTNGLCSTSPDGTYNGVLANPKIPNAQQTTYLGRSYVAIWSGSHAVITVTPVGVCAGFSLPSTTGVVHIRVVDVNGNPMPAGTTIVVSGSAIAPGVITSFVVSNYVLLVGQQFGTGPGQVPIQEYDIPVICTGAPSFLTITVTTPLGVVTTLTIAVNPS